MSRTAEQILASIEAKQAEVAALRLQLRAALAPPAAAAGYGWPPPSKKKHDWCFVDGVPYLVWGRHSPADWPRFGSGVGADRYLLARPTDPDSPVMAVWCPETGGPQRVRTGGLDLDFGYGRLPEAG